VISGNELIHAIGSGFYSVRHKSDIFPLGEIEFENKMYPAPKDYDSYLRRIYGDYTLLPKEEDICTHNYKNIEYKKI
jgi:lipopolysaccharide cholinephosphotransferase